MDWTAIGAIATAAGVLLALGLALWQGRERQADERRAQAERISAWFEPHPGPGPDLEHIDATLANSSAVPVYSVLARVVSVQGTYAHRGEGAPGFPSAYWVLPPGRHAVRLGGWSAGMHGHPAVELAFTDAAGRHWIRRGDGTLQTIRDDPLTHYKLPSPPIWEALRER